MTRRLLSGSRQRPVYGGAVGGAGVIVTIASCPATLARKRTVLARVVDMAAVGDDEPVPLLDRPWVARMLGAADAARAVAIWCEQSAATSAR